MKESNPVEVAEFAKAKGIDNEPSFAWWIPYTLRKRDIIISKLKARAKIVSHKYGIEDDNMFSLHILFSSNRYDFDKLQDMFLSGFFGKSRFCPIDSI